MREDLRRARALVGGASGLTHEDGPPARRVARRSRGAVRSTDQNRADARVIHVELIVGQHPAALKGLREPFRFPQLADEGDADGVRSGLDAGADLEVRVSADLHVLFPLGVTGKPGLAAAGITGRRRPALPAAANGKALEQPAIEADIEPLRPAHAHDVVLVLPPQADFNHVLGIDRKVVMNGDAAARPERQVFALAVVLHDVQRNLERLDRRPRRRQTRREPRQLARDRQVALEMRGGNRENVGEVVEAPVGGIVARQQRSHVGGAAIEAEQIVDGVVVLGAIEAVDCRDAAGTRMCRPGTVDLVLEPAGGGAIAVGIGTRSARRRHRAGPQLLDDPLPHAGVRGWIGHVQRIEGESGGPKLLVMAGDAVAIENGARRRGRSRGSILRLLPRGRMHSRRGDGHPAAGEERDARRERQRSTPEHPDIVPRSEPVGGVRLQADAAKPWKNAMSIRDYRIGASASAGRRKPGTAAPERVIALDSISQRENSADARSARPMTTAALAMARDFPLKACTEFLNAVNSPRQAARRGGFVPFDHVIANTIAVDIKFQSAHIHRVKISACGAAQGLGAPFTSESLRDPID